MTISAFKFNIISLLLDILTFYYLSLFLLFMLLFSHHYLSIDHSDNHLYAHLSLSLHFSSIYYHLIKLLNKLLLSSIVDVSSTVVILLFV